MKKLLLITFLFSVLTTSAQTTTMIAVVLENGKEQEYLNYEKNWNKAAQQMVKDDLITQWSVWKRTPRDGDDNCLNIMYLDVPLRSKIQEKYQLRHGIIQLKKPLKEKAKEP